jgi:site-specific DNA-methyltransferase (adenine-specific)
VSEALFIHGDARRLPIYPESIDAILGDPPYGINARTAYRANGRGRLAECNNFPPIIGDKTPFDPIPWLRFHRVILWGANHYPSRLPDRGRWLVWDKRDGMPSNDNADVEMAWCSLQGVARICVHRWNGMIKASEQTDHRVHPTQKPVALMRWCLQFLNLKPNSLIVDPWCGSGPTAIAAAQEGHRFIGLDLDREYLKIAWTRYHKPWKHIPRPGRTEHRPLFEGLDP